jgi:pyruvate carboxylase
LAAEKGVDAIHPGYGFLSENPALARACDRAGIAFVGPSAELLELLGDKTAARKLAERANIPTIPGTQDAISDVVVAAKTAQGIGFPLIIKAAFGGGGRGMRVVIRPEEFEGRFDEAITKRQQLSATVRFF